LSQAIKLVVDRVAQVGQIDAAERAVPVGAIALAAVEGLAGVGSSSSGAGQASLRPACLVQPPAGHHHPGVHLVGLGILHLEVPPEAAADERRLMRGQPVVFQLVNEAVVLDLLPTGSAHSVISR
jgi:hypothetical protein